MKEQYKMLNRAGIVTLCVFRSPPSHIANYAASVHDHNLLTLSDEKGSVYKAYMVGKSASGFLRDAAKMIKNLPKYKKFVHPGGMAKGATKVTQLPADFLIDENGMIKRVVMGGLMTFEQLEEFIPKEKRCKCNKQDCISRTCREQYELIRKESEAMFGGA
jgi:peroxiredoxin